MKKYSVSALLAASCILLTGCAFGSSEHDGSSIPYATGTSSAAETESTAPEETSPAAADSSDDLQKAAGWLLNAGEMKLPVSEQDDKTGMLFRFTAVTAESCNLTWDAYRITDFANDIGRGISVNGTLYGDQQMTYAPVTAANGTVTGFVLEGAVLKKTESAGEREYKLLISTESAEPALKLIATDGSGDLLALSPFKPEMTEYEWVALASAAEAGSDSPSGDEGLFYTQGNLLMMDGSLFGSPVDAVETRVGYSVGALQPFAGWSVPLETTAFTYNGLTISLMFRAGGLTAAYADYVLDDPYTFFNDVADDAVKAYGAPDAAYSDETGNYVESWYLPDQNVTLYLYTYTETADDTETVCFRQEYTVGKTDRFCGF